MTLDQFLSATAALTGLTFVVASMLGTGLSLTVAQIAQPLKNARLVILASGVGGLTGWDWLWIVMAVVIDVMHYSSTAYSNRNQIPGYKPASTAPATPPPPSQPM
jgi:hypothetical protein